jgi:hypothetical protein
MPEIVVDAKAIEELAADFKKAKRALVSRLAERGYQLLKQEVPEKTGNLKKGVRDPEYDFENLTAGILVSAARDSIGAREAKVFNEEGEDTGKTVTLRAQPAYNYADVVARGNKAAKLTPKTAKAFLIPVPTAPVKGGYLLAGGQIFVIRRSRKGMKANPYDERAAKRLESEASRIGEAVLKQFV